MDDPESINELPIAVRNTEEHPSGRSRIVYHHSDINEKNPLLLSKGKTFVS